MTEHNDILNRLRGLASVPVDDAVSQQHLLALADVATSSGPGRTRRVVVMGAMVAGTMLGSATLASAVTGNLPDPAQDVAHTALAKVGIDVPKAKGKSAEHKQADDTPGPGNVERFLEGCTNPDGTVFEGNHGQYVKAHEDDPATPDVNEREVAAESRCGKPIQAGAEESETLDADTDDGTKKEGTGRPEAPGKSAEHKPDDAGKPSTDDVDTHDDADDNDDTDNSGKGSSSSGKGRSGEAPKAPDTDDSSDGS